MKGSRRPGITDPAEKVRVGQLQTYGKHLQSCFKCPRYIDIVVGHFAILFISRLYCPKVGTVPRDKTFRLKLSISCRCPDMTSDPIRQPPQSSERYTVQPKSCHFIEAQFILARPHLRAFTYNPYLPPESARPELPGLFLTAALFP